MLGISQSTVTPNNNLDVYQGLINGDYCRKTELPNCLKVAADLNQIIQDQSKTIIELSDQRDKDQCELESLHNLKETQAVKVEHFENKSKRFGVGIYAGYGADLKPSVGIGVTYNVFRF